MNRDKVGQNIFEYLMSLIRYLDGKGLVLQNEEEVSKHMDEMLNFSLLRSIVNEPTPQDPSPSQEPTGICGNCGYAFVNYGAVVFQDDELYYPTTCPNCGKEDREYYRLKYSPE